MQKLRWLTISVCVAFLALSAVAILQNLDVQLWVKLGFVAIAAYFIALPFVRHSPWAEV